MSCFLLTYFFNSVFRRREGRDRGREGGKKQDGRKCESDGNRRISRFSVCGLKEDVVGQREKEGGKKETKEKGAHREQYQGKNTTLVEIERKGTTGIKGQVFRIIRKKKRKKGQTKGERERETSKLDVFRLIRKEEERKKRAHRRD